MLADGPKNTNINLHWAALCADSPPRLIQLQPQHGGGSNGEPYAGTGAPSSCRSTLCSQSHDVVGPPQCETTAGPRHAMNPPTHQIWPEESTEKAPQVWNNVEGACEDPAANISPRGLKLTLKHKLQWCNLKGLKQSVPSCRNLLPHRGSLFYSEPLMLGFLRSPSQVPLWFTSENLQGSLQGLLHLSVCRHANVV